MGAITRTFANFIGSGGQLQTGSLATGVGGDKNFRNIIINGDMDISQRETTQASITSDGYYTLDRFAVENGSFGTWTMSQASDAPSGQGFTYALKMDCTTAQGSPASGSLLLIGQSIEGMNLQQIKQGTANAQPTTLSFWHKHTKTGTNIVELLDADNNNAVSGSYTQSVSDTWEKATITFPANTSGTYDNDTNRSLRIRFIMGSGTDYTSGTLATTWQTSITNANRYAGQVNNADSTSNNFIITGVQYEVGSSATDFEFLPHEINHQRCARYYQKVGINLGQYTFAPSHSDGWSGQAQLGVLHLPNIMRANGTTEYSGSWSGRGGLNTDNNCVPGGTLSSAGGAGTTNGSHQYRFSWNANQNSNSLGTGAMYNSNASTNDLAFEAEL
jgi:hypothetical protein